MKSLSALALVLFVAARAVTAADAVPTFEENVLPIFREKCCSCHNADKKQGGLDLTSHARAMAGGSSGEVIAPGDAEGSYLWQLASHSSEPKMPPESDRIPQEMIDTITKWIAGGAIERTGGKPVARKTVSLAIDPSKAMKLDGPPVMPPRLPLDVSGQGLRPMAITGLAASPNGSLVAVGGRKQVLLVDASSLSFLGALPFPEGDVKTLRFSRNAKLLLAGGGMGAKSGKVVIWDVATANRITELGDEFDQVLAADVTADQKTVALGGPQKVVRLVSTEDGSVQAEVKRHTDWITAVEFSPEGRLLATGDRAGNAFVWETRGAREDAVLKGHTSGITSMAWRPDGAVLATACEDGKVRLWDRRTGDKLKEWDSHPGGAQGVAWLADGRIVTTGRDRKVVVWKPEGTRERDFEQLPEIGLRVAVTSDQTRLLVGDLSGRLAAFAVADGVPAGVADTNPPRLDTRLKDSEKVLAERVAAQKAADESLAQARKAVDAARKAAAVAEKAVQERTAAAEKAKAAVAAAEAEAKRWRDEAEFSRRKAGEGKEPPKAPAK
jgi:hypothetical protein